MDLEQVRKLNAEAGARVKAHEEKAAKQRAELEAEKKRREGLETEAKARGERAKVIEADLHGVETVGKVAKALAEATAVLVADSDATSALAKAKTALEAARSKGPENKVKALEAEVKRLGELIPDKKTVASAQETADKAAKALAAHDEVLKLREQTRVLESTIRSANEKLERANAAVEQAKANKTAAEEKVAKLNQEKQSIAAKLAEHERNDLLGKTMRSKPADAPEGSKPS